MQNTKNDQEIKILIVEEQEEIMQAVLDVLSDIEDEQLEKKDAAFFFEQLVLSDTDEIHEYIASNTRCDILLMHNASSFQSFLPRLKKLINLKKPVVLYSYTNNYDAFSKQMRESLLPLITQIQQGKK